MHPQPLGRSKMHLTSLIIMCDSGMRPGPESNRGPLGRGVFFFHERVDMQSDTWAHFFYIYIIYFSFLVEILVKKKI